MEYSLVATLAELVTVTGISILKILKENNQLYAEEVIKLSVNPDSVEPYSWSSDGQIIDADDYFFSCITDSKVISYIHEQGFYRYLFPIREENESIGCLVINADTDLNSQIGLIEGFVRIYENYLLIFNESERDKLTGLFNRRTFDSKLSKFFKSQLKRQQLITSLSSSDDRRHFNNNMSAWLVITDIDHFKKVNDTYGHVFGDEVILTISQIMQASFRRSDLMFRIGGEEFVILLEPVSQDTATKLIGNYLQVVANHPFSQIGTVTVSAGYTRISENDFPLTALECADKALYYAKENGRNCAYNYEKLLEQNKVTLPKKGGAIDLF